jgi:hypothetical protein
VKRPPTPAQSKPVELLEKRFELDSNEPRQLSRKPPRKPAITMEEEYTDVPTLDNEALRPRKSTPRKTKSASRDMTLSELTPSKPSTAEYSESMKVIHTYELLLIYCRGLVLLHRHLKILLQRMLYLL